MTTVQEARLAVIEARKVEERVALCMRVVRKNLDMVEQDHNIKLFALMKLTCLFLVTELMHLPWRQVRQQSFQLFRKSLDELHVKLETVVATERKANDD